MHVRKTVRVSNRRVVVDLPADFEDGRRVTVIVQDAPDEKGAFEAAMAEAANDPLFLADIDEVMEDFKYVDREHSGEDE